MKLPSFVALRIALALLTLGLITACETASSRETRQSADTRAEAGADASDSPAPATRSVRRKGSFGWKRPGWINM